MGPIFGVVDRTDPWSPGMDHPPMDRSYLVVEASCYMALIIVTCKRNSSAGAKIWIVCIYFCQQSSAAAKMRCSAASWTLLSTSLYIYAYIYMYIYIYIYLCLCLCMCIYNYIYNYITVWLYKYIYITIYTWNHKEIANQSRQEKYSSNAIKIHYF